MASLPAWLEVPDTALSVEPAWPTAAEPTPAPGGPTGPPAAADGDGDGGRGPGPSWVRVVALLVLVAAVAALLGVLAQHAGLTFAGR